MSEVEERPRFVMAGYSRHRSQWVKTKTNCSKRMRRLVSVRGFCIRWRIHYIRNHAQMLCGFPYGRTTQHVRCMRSSIVSVIQYVSLQYFICYVMWLRAAVIFQVAPLVPFYWKWNITVVAWLVELHTGQFNKYHLLFSIYNSVIVRVQMYCFSLAPCLLLALIASVRETKKLPNCKFVTKETRKELKYWCRLCST